MDSGMSPNAATATNENGGLQSVLDGRYDLVPPEGIIAVARVCAAGAKKYARGNWRAIPYADHVNHALAHLMALMLDDKQDEHLEHAATRLLFAIATKDPSYRFSEVITGV